jgi:hypothetical protein
MRQFGSSSRRLIGGVGGAGLVATLALAGGSSGPASAGTTATPRCKTAGLVVWLDTNAGAAAGSAYYKLKLTNLSGHACTLTGFPGVSAVDLRGRQIGPAAYRDTTVTPRTIRLANGSTAVALLRVTSPGNYAPSVCHPTTAAGLRVYPPNAVASKVMPYPLRVCARTRVLNIQTVRRTIP